MGKVYRKIPVIKRLYPSLMKQWAALTWPGGYKVKKRHGLTLLLNYKNHVDRRIALNDGYEDGQFSYFLSHMKNGCDVFLDIGACFGIYHLPLPLPLPLSLPRRNEADVQQKRRKDWYAPCTYRRLYS